MTLHGDLVLLRARHESDIAVLDTDLHDDVATDARGTRRPWRPISPGAKASVNRWEAGPTNAPFSVVELASGELAGETALWEIDSHNRCAHIGMALRPAFRGKGLGTDAVRVQCHYAFTVLGLHRLQIETLADNHAMLKAAERSGFTREGLVRDAAWVMGGFADEVLLGLLANEWTQRTAEA
jgi:RimJ/RimL family protein N-acetyltransferase